MNSIDRNQPEKNREDLHGREATGKIEEIISRAKCCFFNTRNRGSQETTTRPMTVLRVETDGRLRFLSANDSKHNRDLQADSRVELYFQASPHSGFLHLTGECEVSTDAALIRELWQPLFKTWFTEGLEDPRITVLTVTPHEGHYWDNKHGNFIAGIKMMIGAAIGRTLDDSLSGKLTP